MLNERRTAFFQVILTGGPPNPFLRVRVRRDHIIDDALVSVSINHVINESYVLYDALVRLKLKLKVENIFKPAKLNETNHKE